MKTIRNILFIFYLLISISVEAQTLRAEPDIYKLKNGMEIIFIPTGTLPVTSVHIFINTGKKNEIPGQQGLADLTLTALLYGSEKYSSIQTEQVLYEMGNGFSSACNDNYTQLELLFPNTSADTAMDLMSSLLLKPLFSKDEIGMYINQLITYNKPKKMDISNLTSIYGDLYVYGTSHPLGRHFYEDQLKKLSGDKIREFYQFNYTPANTKLVISGNPDKEKMKLLIQKHFSSWVAEYGEVNGSSYDIPAIKQKEIFFISKADATQASLHWYKKAPKAGSKEVLPFVIANGIFNTILFDQIRGKEGKTYGIYSVYNEAENREIFEVSTQVRIEVMAETCLSFDKILQSFYLHGISADQLEKQKIAIENEIRGMQSPNELSAFINPWLYKDFSKRKSYLSELAALDINTIQKSIKKYFVPDAYKLFIAGDQNGLNTQLQNLKDVQYIDLKSIEVDQ